MSKTASRSLKEMQMTRLLTAMSATSELNLMLWTSSPVFRERKLTDIKADPGPEESQRAMRGLELVVNNNKACLSVLDITEQCCSDPRRTHHILGSARVSGISPGGGNII